MIPSSLSFSATGHMPGRFSLPKELAVEMVSAWRWQYT
jgi:hypothetical protein